MYNIEEKGKKSILYIPTELSQLKVETFSIEEPINVSPFGIFRGRC